jgi:ABC-type multidrug transport system permease subunit
MSIPNQAAALQAVALGGFLLVFLLSGLMFPIENIPAGLRWISNFIWGRYYIEIVRDGFLQGGGWPAVWFKGAVGLSDTARQAQGQSQAARSSLLPNLSASMPA